MRTPDREEPLWIRTALALPVMALAVFLAGITLLVLQATFSGLSGWLICIFFALTVGGISLWLMAMSLRLLRGTKRPPPKTVPSALAAFCPACGTVRPNGEAGDRAPPSYRDQDRPPAPETCCECAYLDEAIVPWRKEETKWASKALRIAIGGGVTALGLFLAVESSTTPDRGPFALVAFLCLASLLMAVGALLLMQNGRELGPLLLGRGLWLYNEAEFNLRTRDRSTVNSTRFAVTAHAIVQGGQIVFAEGTAALSSSMELDDATEEVPPDEESFARALAVLHASGVFDIDGVQGHLRWSVGTRPGQLRPPSYDPHSAHWPLQSSKQYASGSAMLRDYRVREDRWMELFRIEAGRLIYPQDPVSILTLWQKIGGDKVAMAEFSRIAANPDEAYDRAIELSILRELRTWRL